MTTYIICPECQCGPGEEHKRLCSFWRRSRYHKDQWKPRTIAIEIIREPLLLTGPASPSLEYIL
jgi:hypothetical protein